MSLPVRFSPSPPNLHYVTVIRPLAYEHNPCTIFFYFRASGRFECANPDLERHAGYLVSFQNNNLGRERNCLSCNRGK
jgi:hypothetical protein